MQPLESLNGNCFFDFENTEEMLAILYEIEDKVENGFDALKKNE